MKRYVPPWIALGVVLVLTIVASLEVKKAIERDAVAEFAFASDQVTLKIRERLDAYALILKGGASLFAASKAVGRSEWQAYIETLRAQDSIPGVQGIGFSQVIPPHQLAAHIARIRAEGFPDYKVRPAGERALYTSIIYLEPFRDRNLRAFGFDMFSEPVRRAAMVQARDSGAPALSGKVELVQENGAEVQAGTLMYVPVYRNGAPTDTVKQRRAALIGWVYSPYRMTDLLEGILVNWDDHKNKSVHLRIYGGLEAKADNLLYDSHPARTHEIDPLTFQQRTIDFNDQHWLLLFHAGEGVAPISYASAWATLAGGIMLSSLLCGLMLALARQVRAREIADTLAEEIRLNADSLRQSEDLLNASQRLSKVGGWAWNVETQTMYWTEETYRIHDFARGEIEPGSAEHINRSAQCYGPEDRPVVLAAFQRCVAEGEPYDLELPFTTAKGQQLWIRTTARPVRERGKVVRVIGSIMDITERKQAEEALREQLDFSDSLIETAQAIILVLDNRGCIVRFNPYMEELAGYDLDEVRERDWFETFLTPEIEATIKPLFQKTVADIHTSGNVNPIVAKDGRLILVEWYNKTLKDKDGCTVGVLAIGQDITERKRAEAELDSHRHHLEQLVDTRTVELVAARDAAEASNRAKSAFLANMSHELRTPMNGVLGMIEIAKRCMVDPKGLDHLAKARTATDNLLVVLNDILDMSKIDAGRMVFESVPLQISTVVENLISTLGHKATEKGLRLATDIPAELAGTSLQGDPLRLGQILFNLVGNAIKFTERGEVILGARALGETPETVQVRFEVSDTGIGIEPEVQSRLFQSFEQADNSMTRKYGGTGLGLAICKHLVQLMEGEIGVDSTPGQGSTFWFVVPLKKREQDAVTPASTFSPLMFEQRLQTKYAGTRILLAEDEPVNREIASLQLGYAGLLVDVAEDGQQALELARQNRYALILMDMQMPVMNGVEATHAIRAASLNTTTPILAMTANAFDEDRDACFDAGMNGHISKPVDSEKLYETLLEWLEKRIN